MTIQVELSAEAEHRLVTAARDHGVAPEAFAGSLLQKALGAEDSGSGRLTAEELRTMLSQIGEGADRLPILPAAAFSRESFYEHEDRR